MSDRTTEDGANGKSPKAAKKKGGSSGDGGGESKRGESKGATGKPGGNLGRVLRTAYDETLREPVPDDFLDLLGRLE